MKRGNKVNGKQAERTKRHLAAFSLLSIHRIAYAAWAAIVCLITCHSSIDLRLIQSCIINAQIWPTNLLAPKRKWHERTNSHELDQRPSQERLRRSYNFSAPASAICATEVAVSSNRIDSFDSGESVSNFLWNLHAVIARAQKIQHVLRTEWVLISCI